MAEYDGEPNGMKFMDAGTLLITDYKNGLMRLDIATGRVTPYLERRNSERFKGVNDLIFDADGNLYFTDQGQSGLHDPSGRLYRLRPNGQLDLLLANVPSPNGVALSHRRPRAVPGRHARQLRVARAAAARWQRGQGGAVLHVVRSRAAQTGWRWMGRGACWWPTRAWVMCGCSTIGPSPCWCCGGLPEPPPPIWRYGGQSGQTVFVTDSTHGHILCARLDAPGLPLHRSTPD